MFTHYRTEGIVIKKIERGEADLLLVVYTGEFGRVEVMARGARKAASKLRPAIEFTAVIEIEFIQGKTCKTLTDAVIINSLGGSRKDLQKSCVLRQICDFTERTVKEERDDGQIWELLVSTVVFLNGSDSARSKALYHYFVWHLFQYCGWRPEFDARNIDAENLSLVNFFRDADIERGTRMKLAGRQDDLLCELAQNYLLLVTR